MVHVIQSMGPTHQSPLAHVVDAVDTIVKIVNVFL